MANCDIENKHLKFTFKVENPVKIHEDANIVSEDQNNSEIRRDIVRPEDIYVSRKEGEGKSPLFDRKDIKVNKIKTVIDYSKVTKEIGYNNMEKDMNFNISRQSPFSETTRAVSKLTEDTLDMLTKNQNSKSSIELVRDYLEKLAEIKEKPFSDHVSEKRYERNRSKSKNRKSRRSNSVSSASSKDSFSDNSYKKSYTESRKRHRRESPDPSEILYRLKKSYNAKRYRSSSDENRSDSSLSDEVLEKYKKYLDKFFSDNDNRKSVKKYKCDCHDCRSKNSRCNKRPSSHSSYDKYYSSYHKNKDHRLRKEKSYSSYGQDIYNTTTEEDDVELKYHRFNAAMYAVYVIFSLVFNQSF